MGDPAGVGPEVMVKALNQSIQNLAAAFVVVCSPSVMDEAAGRFGSSRLREKWKENAPVRRMDEAVPSAGSVLALAASDLAFTGVNPGKPDRETGKSAWQCLEAGLETVKALERAALVTAPVSKLALHQAGFPFPGHTDWLEAGTGARALMMIAAESLRVVPLTMHVPLAQVPGLLIEANLVAAIETIHRELKGRFGIDKPRIAVSGLNPHAGEAGVLGSEEIEIIQPAIERLKKKGVNVSGPFPADTMFTKPMMENFDAAACMYHDQALIPIKTLYFDRAVNVTLGLPLIRTSPAHGTAETIAWRGVADAGSMAAALDMAFHMAELKGRAP